MLEKNTECVLSGFCTALELMFSFLLLLVMNFPSVYDPFKEVKCWCNKIQYWDFQCSHGKQNLHIGVFFSVCASHAKVRNINLAALNYCFIFLPVWSNVKTLMLLVPVLSSILEAWFSLILLLFTAPYHIYTNLITVWNFKLKYISNISSYYECIVLGFYLKF